MTYYAWGAEYQHGEQLWVATTKRGEILPGLRRARFCNYTPAFIELFAPLTRLTQKAAFWIWIALQLLSLAAAMILLARNCDPPLDLATTAVVVAFSYLFRTGCSAPRLRAMGASATAFDHHFMGLCAPRPTVAGGPFARRRSLAQGLPGRAGGLLRLQATVARDGMVRHFPNPRNYRHRSPQLDRVPASRDTRISPSLANLNISVLAYSAVTISRWLSTGGPSEVLAMTAALTAAGDVAIVAVAAFVTAHAGERAESQGLAFALWAMAALLL